MTHLTWKSLAAGVFWALATASTLHAQQPASAAGFGAAGPPDVILSNGKIITVDEKFSIAQAVAVRGDRIVAVGTSQDIARLAGPDTRRIDLRGRAVTPGLIDHHGHYLREGSTFQEEVRWEGIETRRQALDMLRAKVRADGPGVWLYNLMGWSLDQFTDDKRPFTREELDRVAPDNPVALQEAYFRIYLNSRALRELGINDTLPDPQWIPAGQVVRDAAGRATGIILDEGTRPLDSRLLAMPRPRENIEASHRAMVQARRRLMPRQRILAVDDEPGMLRAIERVLASRYDVRTCRVPSEAIEMAGAEMFDLARSSGWTGWWR